MLNPSLCQPPSKKAKSDQPLAIQSLEESDESDDFSFLDDIDVDEIAACLNNCDKSTNHKPNFINVANSESNQDVAHEKDNYIQTKNCKAIKVNNNISIIELENHMSNYFKEEYRVCSIIHTGNFSKIIKCIDSNSKNVVVKMLKSNINAHHGRAKLDMFLQIQSNIAKENLFCIYFITGFSIQKYWCFLMEYYPKSLSEAMQELNNKPLYIQEVQNLARQLVAAVTHLKYNGIVHSDIKPSHILLDGANKNLKLCGFDDAHYNGAFSLSPNRGTSHYRSPEIILGYRSGFSIDVWSTAIVLVEMALGETLFPGYSNHAILYEQMYMLGNIPHEMLAKSQFKHLYFVKNMFKKRTRFGDILKKCEFYKTDKLEKMVTNAQWKHWISDCNSEEKRRLLNKVNTFTKLINRMIVICPENRMAIDDVYSDPFIYAMFDW